MKKITALTAQFIVWTFVLTLLFLNVKLIAAQEKTLPAVSKTDAAAPKFALLVGITNYKSKEVNKIDGCENNVPLLRETLIKDYGFDESAVVSLLNDQATKAAIIANFRSHLIENAKKSKAAGKEAVVVYYFCGHGSQYPDQDADENDAKDETFVAYDSRTADVFDVLDDELDDLKAELRPLTSNTTLILESCHSGTGSRSAGELISEETAADARKKPQPYRRKFPPSTDADWLTYTEIAASLSSNTAKSESAEFCQCDKPQSLMTKALIQGLKRATAATTYRSLTREISSEVAAQSRQEPQVEGNRDAVLFGGAAKRANPYIEIEKLLSADQIVIRAGTIHGLKEGSQVSIYSSESLINTGKTGWLVNGVVASIGNAASIVQLPKASENPAVERVKITSHVVLASPVFGGGAVFLALNPSGAKTPSDADETALHKQIEERLASEGLFERQVLKIIGSEKLAAADRKDAKGIVRLKKGLVGDIFSEGKGKNSVFNRAAVNPLLKATRCEGDTLKINPETERFPARDATVYYLDDGESGGLPLFGKTFDPADGNLASDIAETVRSFAFQRTLLGLDNQASTLASQIKVSLQTIPDDAIVEFCRDGRKSGKLNPEKISAAQPIKNNRIPIDSLYLLKIKNISGEINKKADEFAAGEPFHISVIALTNSGEIKNIYASKGANDHVQDGIEKIVALRTTEPIGIERFIVIVSKDHVDFSFYESSGTRRNAASVLERILTQSGKLTRDGAVVSDAPDRWDVIHLELNIVSRLDR